MNNSQSSRWYRQAALKSMLSRCGSVAEHSIASTMRKVPSSGAHRCLLESLILFLSISVSLSLEQQQPQHTVGCPQENPIIVIGVGLSGISAAQRLKDAGCPTIILEAKDRVGGRMHSQTFGTTIVDLGGRVDSWTGIRSARLHGPIEFEHVGLGIFHLSRHGRGRMDSLPTRRWVHQNVRVPRI
jgi:hypothetical protein